MEEVMINWFAVGAATLVGFVIGFLWYGPLFGKVWMKEAGLSEEDVNNGNMAKIFGLTAVFQFIMAYCLAMFFGNDITASTGALYGFLAGFAWVALSIAVLGLYEQRSFKYMIINGGFWTIVFTLMGLIIGAWR